MLRAALLFQALLVAFAAVSSGNTRIDYTGQSGQMKIYPANEVGFIQIKMDSLAETTASGGSTSNKITTFANQEFTWSTPTPVTRNGVDGMFTYFSATLSNNAKFGLNTTIWVKDVVVSNGNQTITVPANTLKFDVDVTNWPFLATTNELSFGLSVATKGDKGDAKRSEGASGSKVTVADGYIEAPSQCVADGVNKPAPLSISQNGKNTILLWKFPYFASTLRYDPIVNPQASGGGIFSVAISALLFGLLAHCF
jgi:hypothetical protein